MWDHLRVCGADTLDTSASTAVAGSSPRVRSRLGRGHRQQGVRGIISACAEQTRPRTTTPPSGRDHLRVCGADVNGLGGSYVIPGSSPRVRSRRRGRVCPCATCGIISACAEQTRSQRSWKAGTWDHLRVCGADLFSIIDYYLSEGSSPRVRSRPFMFSFLVSEAGIISACAEQTWCRNPRRNTTGDHLRVCGADLFDGSSV